MKLTISEEEKNRIKNLYGLLSEQRISDLPQNQQTNTGPKPNLGPAPKSKDLRTTLSPQQQQKVKDMTRGQKDLSKVYYGSKQKMSPVGKKPGVVEKVRLIFPKNNWEKLGLSLLRSFNIFTGYFESLSEALRIVGDMSKDGVKTKELVIGSHGGGEQLLMTKSGEDYKFDNSFLEDIKQIVTPSTKVFFTACHGADNLEMLKDAAEKLGVGAYASKGIYNFVTNESEKGFYWCSPNSFELPTYDTINSPLNSVDEQKKQGLIQVQYLSDVPQSGATVNVSTSIFGEPINITIDSSFFKTSPYGGGTYKKGKHLNKWDIYLVFEISEYIQKLMDSGSNPVVANKLFNNYRQQLKKTPNMKEFIVNEFINDRIKININGVDVKTLKSFKLPTKIGDDFLLNNNLCRKVENSPVSWIEPVN
jgi:hypothetical protein